MELKSKSKSNPHGTPAVLTSWVLYRMFHSCNAIVHLPKSDLNEDCLLPRWSRKRLKCMQICFRNRRQLVEPFKSVLVLTGSRNFSN